MVCSPLFILRAEISGKIWHGAQSGTDSRGMLTGITSNSLQCQTTQQADNKNGSERITRTDRVPDLRRNTRLIDRPVRRHKQCPFGASRHDDQVKVELIEQGTQSLLRVARRTDTTSSSHLLQFVVAELEHTGKPDRFSNQNVVIIGRPKIDIENTSRLGSLGYVQRPTDRRAGYLAPLPQRTEVNGICRCSARLQFRSPANPIPRRVFMDNESRLARPIQAHSHRPGGCILDYLDRSHINVMATEYLDRLVPPRIISNRTHHGDIGSEHRSMTSKVRRRAAKSRAFRKQIPENFSKRQNSRVTHVDTPNSCSISSSGRPFVSGTMTFTQMS